MFVITRLALEDPIFESYIEPGSCRIHCFTKYYHDQKSYARGQKPVYLVEDFIQMDRESYRYLVHHTALSVARSEMITTKIEDSPKSLELKTNAIHKSFVQETRDAIAKNKVRTAEKIAHQSPVSTRVEQLGFISLSSFNHYQSDEDSIASTPPPRSGTPMPAMLLSHRRRAITPSPLSLNEVRDGTETPTLAAVTGRLTPS